MFEISEVTEMVLLASFEAKMCRRYGPLVLMDDRFSSQNFPLLQKLTLENVTFDLFHSSSLQWLLPASILLTDDSDRS